MRLLPVQGVGEKLPDESQLKSNNGCGVTMCTRFRRGDGSPNLHHERHGH
jgi:hypothetical protein